MSRKPIIVFEGIETSGKSHHISVVAKHLKNKRISFPPNNERVKGRIYKYLI